MDIIPESLKRELDAILRYLNNVVGIIPSGSLVDCAEVERRYRMKQGECARALEQREWDPACVEAGHYAAALIDCKIRRL